LKGNAANNLTGSRLGSGSIDPSHIAVAACTTALVIERGRRERIGACQHGKATSLDRNGARQEQTIEYVLEFSTNLKFHVVLAIHIEEAADSERFRGLPLPPVITEVPRSLSELTWCRVDPSVGIQHKIFGGIDATTLGIF